jgi:signal transduction histidine kinase
MDATSQRMAAMTSGRILVLVSAAVVVAFLGSTWLSQRRAAQIDDDAQSIIVNAMPSVQYLGQARTDVHRLEAAAERYTAARGDHTPVDIEWLEGPRRDLQRAIGLYLALPFYPEERKIFDGISPSLQRLDAHLARIKDGRPTSDAELSHSLAQVRGAALDVDATLQRIMDFDAAQGQRLSRKITSLRQGSTDMAYAFTLVSLLLAVAATILSVRELRRSAAISRRLELAQRERADLLAQRCVELEHFADRVAHDILSPLAGVGVALAIAQRVETGDPKVKNAVDRGVATLMRVRRMVDGLLDFARSGARAIPDREADVRAVLEDVVEGVRADAEQRKIEVRIDPIPPSAVRCSEGILTSLVSNLVRNALKYMGDSAVRRITLSLSDRGDRWRVTVQDTGPGIPEAKRGILFEPYVRGESSEPGIGLGLATVKRLAEAHGGTVGVESRPGQGAAFWFELPKAAPITNRPELRA